MRPPNPKKGATLDATFPSSTARDTEPRPVEEVVTIVQAFARRESNGESVFPYNNGLRMIELRHVPTGDELAMVEDAIKAKLANNVEVEDGHVVRVVR
jgi:hypothetical protein